MREYFIWLAKVLTFFIIIAVGIPTMIGAVIVAGKEVVGKDGRATLSDKKVAVVELTGAIEDSKEIVESLYKLTDDPHIDGIVLRIDSPGGAVAPSQDLYETVLRLKERKPIIVSMGSVAASGGFYTAVAGTKVIAQPGTMTGSIGVIMQIPNVSKIADTIGFNMITIRAGSMKDAGNSFRAMTPEEKVYLEKTAATVHAQFIRDIAAARKLPIDKVKEFADGRVILGEEAKALGLIDGFGDVYDAARMVYEVKGQPLNKDEVPDLQYEEDSFKEFRKKFHAVLTLPKLFFKNAPELRAQMY